VASASPTRPPRTRRLASALLAFSEERTAVAELEDLKHVISEADAALGGRASDDPELAAALRLLLPLLVQDGARLLHRQLCGYVRRLPEGARAVAGREISGQLVRAARWHLQQADAAAAAVAAGGDTSAEAVPAWVKPALSVSQAAASLTLLPTAAAWLAPAAGPLLRLSARGINALLAAAEAGVPLSPVSMDQLQEAISALIFLLTNHGRQLAAGSAAAAAAAPGDDSSDGNGVGSGSSDAWWTPADDEAAIFEACQAGLRALRSHALVREAMVSSAVAVWHAAQLPAAPPAAAALVFARGLAIDGGRAWTATSGGDGQRRQKALRPSAELQAVWDGASLVERRMAAEMDMEGGPGAAAAARRAHGSCMAAQLARVSPLGRLCALKGVMMSLPPHALCHNLDGGGSSGGDVGGSSWCLLVDGALPASAITLQTAADSDFKYHAASTLLVALQRCRSVWQQLAAEGGGGGGDADGSATSPGLELPWLLPEARSYLMGVLWALIDEPVPQTLRQVQDAFNQLFGLLPLQAACAARLGRAAPPGCGAADADAFCRAAAAAVLRMPPGRKGRYSPLLSLLPRVGAAWMVEREPRLVDQVLRAMCNDMVANTATLFFKGLLTQLKEEAAAAAAGDHNTSSSSAATPPAAGEEAGDPAWCAAWLPAFVHALSGPDERLRAYVASHGLPTLLQAEPGLLHTLLRALLLRAPAAGGAEGPANAATAAEHGRMAAVVVVLRAGRQLQLLGDLSDIDSLTVAAGGGGSGGGAGAASARELLLSCVASSSEPLRLACLELACVHPRCAENKRPLPPAFLLLPYHPPLHHLPPPTDTNQHPTANRRTSEPPGAVDFQIIKSWLLLSMRCPSSSGRSQSLVMLSKMLTRCRASVYALRTWLAAARAGGAAAGFPTNAKSRRTSARRAAAAAAAAAAGNEAGAPAPAAAEAEAAGREDAAAAAYAALERIQDFMQSLSSTLLASLYPGGPFERRLFAQELLLSLLEIWGETAWASSAAADTAGKVAEGGEADGGGRHWQLLHAFQPFDEALRSQEATAALMGGVVDNRDKLRAGEFGDSIGHSGCYVSVLCCLLNCTLPHYYHKLQTLRSPGAARALSLLPTPLPGLETPAALLPLLSWARQLLLSPRLRESDAGARIVKLIFDDYVIRLGWRVTIWPELSITAPPAGDAGVTQAGPFRRPLHPDGVAAAVGMLRSLAWKADQQLDLARRDLAAACRHGLAHGPLLAVRYACDGLPWADAAAGEGAAELRTWVTDLLELLQRVAAVALPPLARQDQNVAAGDVDEDDQDLEEEEDGLEGDEEAPATAAEGERAGGAPQQLGPVPQVVNTGCWTSLKEVAGVAMTLVSSVPLPGSSSPEAAAPAGGGTAASSASSSDELLWSCAQLEAAGSMLVELLLHLKHNGAVDKVQANFALLCGRLLRSEVEELRKLPGRWLRVCLAHMVRPGGFRALVASLLCRWCGEKDELHVSSPLSPFPPTTQQFQHPHPHPPPQPHPGQSLNDIVRRSAGLPYAIIALFLAEPPGAPRQLLPEGMPRLLAIARDLSLDPWPRVGWMGRFGLGSVPLCSWPKRRLPPQLQPQPDAAATNDRPPISTPGPRLQHPLPRFQRLHPGPRRQRLSFRRRGGGRGRHL
jgi:hypothetical protein